MGSLPGVGKAEILVFSFFFFCFRNVARTKKLPVKGDPGQHFSTTSHPITFLLLPHVYILLPSDGWDRMGITLLKISSSLQIIRRRGSNQVQDSVLRTEKRSTNQTLHVLHPTPCCTHKTTLLLL